MSNNSPLLCLLVSAASTLLVVAVVLCPIAGHFCQTSSVATCQIPNCPQDRPALLYGGIMCNSNNSNWACQTLKCHDNECAQYVWDCSADTIVNLTRCVSANTTRGHFCDMTLGFHIMWILGWVAFSTAGVCLLLCLLVICAS
jgi:hypothetical protein